MTSGRERKGRPSRRQALRILAVSGAAGAAWLVGRRGLGQADAVTRQRLLMGTGVTLTVVGTDRDAAGAAADAMLAEMAALEALLSAYRPDSEVSRLNAHGYLAHPSPALREVLRLAAHTAELGDGGFDLTVQPVLDLYGNVATPGAGLPDAAAIESARGLVGYRDLRVDDAAVRVARAGMRITVDGIATGYIIDRGVAVVRGRGFDNVLVDVGGDVMLSGERAAGLPWRVGVRNPRPGVALLGRFEASNRAVATSGDYMHAFTADRTRHHIIDPRSGYSPPELASSTVIAPDTASADALSTLTLVLGARRSRELIESLPGCEGFFVGKDGTVTRTTGFILA